MRQNPVYRVPLWYIAGIAACFSITPVHAGVFMIDDFSITRNSSLFFQDSFSDGSPPPSIPVATFGDGQLASYDVNGTMGPESGGKLALNTSLGDPQFNPNETATNLVLRARAQSNINPANLTLGLKSDDTFAVVGIFDLILPATRERYGIHLNDSAGGVEGSDLVDITVTRLLDGTLVIQFRHNDDLGNTQVIVDSVLLDTSHQQIGLALSRNSLLNSSITASFAYIDGNVQGPITTFGNTTTIFDGENWTRAEFRATERLDVPEPSIVLLLGSGLIGWGALAYRRQRSTR